MAVTGTGWTSIVDLTDDGQDVSDKLDSSFSNIDTDLTALDNRMTAAENNHTLILSGDSAALSQEPTAVDTAKQVEFGGSQTTTHVDISATGALTFKTTGTYIITTFFQYGREGATGTSYLMNRLLINGTQSGNSLAAKIDNANVLVPWSSTIIVDVTATDVVTIEIIRDSAGSNSGGLFNMTSTAGWTTAPCASVRVYKVN